MCAILSKIVQIPNFMKILIYIITFLFATSCHSQEKNTLQATQDDALTIGTTGGMNGGCKFLEQPVYYVNENGVFGRKAGTKEGFAYSDAMKTFGTGKIWGWDEMDQFLTAPGRHIPGTKMSFAGLPKVEDRANVIAYLATMK